MAIIRRKPFTYPGHVSDFVKLFFSPEWRDGPYIAQFEERFKKDIGTSEAVATSFGLHALSIILKFYKIEGDAEILIPNYTAKVVQRCLEESHIRYQCVDIDPLRGTMSFEALEKKITPFTKAILVTHLLGNVCDPRVIELARKRDLIVIEDCAHSQGAHLNGKMTGTLGDAGFFSFSYSKLMNTYTGGMLVTNDKRLASFARVEIQKAPKLSRKSLLRKFLMGHVENVVGVPWITTLLAPLIGSSKLLRLIKDFVNKSTRSSVLSFYQFTNTQAFLGLKQCEIYQQTLERKRELAHSITSRTSLDYLKRDDGDVLYNFIAIVPDAEKMHFALRRYGIDTGYKSSIMVMVKDSEVFPGSQMAWKKYLLLPNYDSLTTKQLDHIVTSINKIKNS